MKPEPGPIDWEWVFRCLTVGEVRGDHYWPGPRLKPWEIGKVTVPEAAALVLSPGARTRSGQPAMSDAMIDAYISLYQSLTPAEKVERAKAGTL